MVLIYLKSGECLEIEAATSVRVLNGTLHCFDSAGTQVADLDADDVQAFTANPEIAETLLDEVCDELTVVPKEPEEPSPTRT